MIVASILSVLEGIWGILLIALFFGGSIFVHELGHFLAARRRGLKIERFSIGMGPRLFGWTGKDGVDYRVSLFPLGGYVALPQMVDMEAIEGKNASDPDALPPISYADKMIVAVMGAVFNVLFAFALACVLWATKMPGTESVTSTTIGYVHENLPGNDAPSPAKQAGLLPGDKVLMVDDEPVASFGQITEKIGMSARRDERGQRVATLKILRGGDEKSITVHPELYFLRPSIGYDIRTIGIQSAEKILIDQPSPESPAGHAGLQQGDHVVALDNQPVFSMLQFKDILDARGAKPVEIRIQRGPDNTPHTLTVTPVLHTDTAETARITFRDGDSTHSLKLVATPDELFTQDPKAERRNLTICDSLPPTSEFFGKLEPGTVITSINLPKGILAVRTPADLAAAAKEIQDGKVTLFCRNGNDKFSITLSGFRAEEIAPQTTPYIGIRNITKPELVRKTPFEQFSYAFGITFATIEKLVNPSSDITVNHLMGVVSMAKTYYSVADDLRRVLWFTIIININLAILNLLPIPVLDGGHMLIATIQKLLGRPIPLKILATVQYVFVFFFISLMGYVIFNDFRRWGGDNTFALQQKIYQEYIIRPAPSFVEEPKS